MYDLEIIVRVPPTVGQHESNMILWTKASYTAVVEKTELLQQAGEESG